MVEQCHLEAYPDPLTGGLPITIGWGNTRDEFGGRFRLGDVITQERADRLFDLSIRDRYLPGIQRIPYYEDMNENQRGALLSFAFNLGADFYDSTGFATITRVLRDKQWNKVPDAFMLYVNPKSKAEAGLRRRRAKEGLLWSLGPLDKMDWSW